MEQMAQLVQELQRQNTLMEQRVNQQQQLMQQQYEALRDLGTAQVARAAQDSKESHVKAFTKIKPFKGDANQWADWRYKFRAEACKSFKDAKLVLDWAEEHYDKPISASDVSTEAGIHQYADMISMNQQLHSDLVSLMEDGTDGFEIVRNSAEDVGLDAWRRLNHRFDPMNPLRILQMLRKLLRPSQVGFDQVTQAIEKWEQDFRILKHRCGDDIRRLWEQIHMVCIQEICPKTLKDHLAVQASSIDSPDKQKVAVERFLQANVHGSGASPMDIDALAKGKGGGKGKYGKGGKSASSDKFEGECHWCLKKGHMVKDCWDKQAGKPRAKGSQAEKGDKGAKGRGKDKGKASWQNRKGANSLEEWPGDGEPASGETAGGLFIAAVDTLTRYTREERSAWSMIQQRAQQEWREYKTGKPQSQVNELSTGERVDLTIDSGAAVCGIPPDSAKDVPVEKIKGPTKEYIAANGDSITELGKKSPTLAFQNGDVEKLDFKVMKIHKPLVAVSKIVAARNRVVFQPEDAGGSFIENLKTKTKKRVYEKHGVYVLPSWVVDKPAAEHLAPIDKACPNGRPGHP